MDMMFDVCSQMNIVQVSLLFPNESNIRQAKVNMFLQQRQEAKDVPQQQQCQQP